MSTISIDQSIETEDNQVYFELEEKGLGPEEKLLQKETQNLVHRALQEIPADNRMVLILRDIKNLTYDEISEVLNIPKGTVKSRINRGRLALKEVLTARGYNISGEEV